MFKGKKFRPSLVATFGFIVALPALIALGIWQLNRASQKEALQNEYDARSQQPPIALGAKQVDREQIRYYKVSATGTYDFAHQFLVDNRVLDTKVGYYVVTPLKISGSDTLVLVNRGWVIGNPDRRILPKANGPRDTVRVQGVAVVPHDKVFQLAKEPEIGAQWPKVWQRVNIKRFANAVNQPVQPFVILLSPDSNAGGFTRKWKRLDTGIAINEGYAFQWFSMALALTGIFFLVNLKPDTKESSKE
jgi:surfeit locus 1 family protein